MQCVSATCARAEAPLGADVEQGFVCQLSVKQVILILTCVALQ